MKKIAVCLQALALLGWLSTVTSAAEPRSDFALFDQESVGYTPDISVQCGATNPKGRSFSATVFVVYITMTNRGDLGGMDGFVRVTYQDGDFVDYAILRNTTLQITLSGGGTPDRDLFLVRLEIQVFSIQQNRGLSSTVHRQFGGGYPPNPCLTFLCMF